MAYIIKRSDVTATPIVVDDGTVNSTPPLSIGLVGRNTIDYGQPIAATQMHVLENFANGTAPSNPVPGQIWYNNVTKVLNVNTGSGDGPSLAAWRPLVASTGPLQPKDPALTGLSNIGASSAPSNPNQIIMSTGTDTFVYIPVGATGQALISSATPAAARTTLGLGTAALATLQTSTLDSSANRVLIAGAFGLGVTTNQPSWPNTSLKNCTGVAAGSYRVLAGTTDKPPTMAASSTGLVEYRISSSSSNNIELAQTVLDTTAPGKFYFNVSKGTGTLAAPAWAGWTEGGGGGGSGQPFSPALTGIAALTYSANDMIVATGASTFSTVPTKSYGRSLLSSNNAGAAGILLGLTNAATITATTAATANTIVLRDGSGAIPVAAITGNAATATKLLNSRTINGVSFDGTANITVYDSTKLPINGSSPMTGALQVTYGAGATPTYNTGQIQMSSGSSNPVVIGFHRPGFTACALVHTGNGLELQDTTWGSRANFASANLTVTGTITSSGTITSTGGDVIAYSDRRLKTNIEPITDALAKINTLTGVTYEQIESGKRSTGLIAQDVQAVLPEAVHEADDEEKTLGLAYGNLAGILVEAIKELSATVATLQAEIAELKAAK